MADLVVRKSLSVRETEALVRRMCNPAPAATPAPRQSSIRPQRARLQQELTERLGAKVLIEQGSGGKGKLVVSYNSLDELDGILASHPVVHTLVIEALH